MNASRVSAIKAAKGWVETRLTDVARKQGNDADRARISAREKMKDFDDTDLFEKMADMYLMQSAGFGGDYGEVTSPNWEIIFQSVGKDAPLSKSLSKPVPPPAAQQQKQMHWNPGMVYGGVGNMAIPQYGMYSIPPFNPLQQNILQEASGGFMQTSVHPMQQFHNQYVGQIEQFSQYGGGIEQATAYQRKRSAPFYSKPGVGSHAAQHPQVELPTSQVDSQPPPNIGGIQPPSYQLPITAGAKFYVPPGVPPPPPPPPADVRGARYGVYKNDTRDSRSSSVEDVSREFTLPKGLKTPEYNINISDEFEGPTTPNKKDLVALFRKTFKDKVKLSLSIVPSDQRERKTYRKAFKRLMQRQSQFCESRVLNECKSCNKNEIKKMVNKLVKIPTNDEVYKEMTVTSQSSAKVVGRIQRFQNDESQNLMDWRTKLQLLSSQDQIVGRSEKLEKGYLRLTTVADPATVRSEPVLKKALKYVLEKYDEKGKNWNYLEDQLKAIRQDLNVQGVRSAFTVEVYEVNCRTALFHSNIGQYNQAQTQLCYLYEDALEGKSKDDWLTNYDEFMAYRMLYLIFNEIWAVFLSTRIKHNTAAKGGKGWKYVFALYDSLRDNNYTRFYKLSAKPPYVFLKYLIDTFIDKIRMRHLVRLGKGSLSIDVDQLTSLFLMDTRADCEDWIMEQSEVTDFLIFEGKGNKKRLIELKCVHKGVSILPSLMKSKLLSSKKLKELG